jgi:hypothetical protein
MEWPNGTPMLTGAFMRRSDFFLFAAMLGSPESHRPVEARRVHRGQHFVF